MKQKRIFLCIIFILLLCSCDSITSDNKKVQSENLDINQKEASKSKLEHEKEDKDELTSVVDEATRDIRSYNTANLVKHGNYVFYCDSGYYKYEEEGEIKYTDDDTMPAIIQYNIETGEKTVLINTEYDTQSFIIHENYLFYIYDMQINRINLTDKKNDLVLKSFDGCNYSVIDNYIIYVNKQHHLVKYSLDKDENTNLLSEEICYIKVVGDWIYYQKEIDDVLYRINIDGSQNSKVINYIDKYSIGRNGNIYYIVNDGLYQSKLDGSSQKPIILGDNSLIYCEIGDFIYYYSALEGSSARINIQTGINEEVELYGDIVIGNFLYTKYEPEPGVYVYKKVNLETSEISNNIDILF